MTRINIVPHRLLSDQHLLAELKELNQFCGSYRKSHHAFRRFHLNGKSDKLPTEYRLGTGHVKFFFDKFGYILQRRLGAVQEVERRNMRVHAPFGILIENIHHSDFNDYVPTNHAKVLNASRILANAMAQRGPIRYRGQPLLFTAYRDSIVEWLGEPVLKLPSAYEEDRKPDWKRECAQCGATPVVPSTAKCGPCTFGHVATAGGNW